MPVKGVFKIDPEEPTVKPITKPRCAINMRRLVKRRRKPHEIPSRPYAGYNRCRECRGWEGDDRSLAEEVEACPKEDCPLWEVRCRNASKSAYIDNRTKRPPDVPPENSDPDISTKKGVKPSSNSVLRRTREWSKIIPEYCAWCQCLRPGESRDPIRKCSSPLCWLYPWRNGKLDKDTYEPETLEDLELRLAAGSKARERE